MKSTRSPELEKGEALVSVGAELANTQTEEVEVIPLYLMLS